jgi:hypothetical protein
LPPKGGGTGTDAWGSFDYPTSSLVSSYNCTLVKNSTGDLSVTFGTPMPTANYSVTAAISSGSNALIRIRDKTINGFKITTGNVSETFNSFVNCSVDFQVNATNATLPSSFTESQIQSVLDFIAVANPAGVAKAWGNVADDGTLNDGLNASTSRASKGRYEIVFTAPLPSANYSVQVTTVGDLGSPNVTAYNPTTTGFMIRTNDGSGAVIDRNFTFTVHSN